MKSIFAILTLLLVALAPSVQAAQHTVPGGFKTIQAAVDQAQPGDVVVVGPGWWNEAVDLKGKAITLRSRDGADKTTLDGTSLKESVLRCLSGESKQTIIDGFTVTNGTGHEALYGSRTAVGGGLLVLGAAPTIRNCVFQKNDVAYNGGGVYLARGAKATFETCTFLENGAEKGGAVYSVQSNATFDGCHFKNNEGRYSGGGMYNADNSQSVIKDCRFERNRANYYGGAIYEYGSKSDISNCKFDRNRATYKGGAVYNGYRGQSKIKSCTFLTNYDDVYGGEGPTVTAVAPTGACVLSGGSCLHVSRQSCEDAKGTYLGDGSDCDSNKTKALARNSDLNRDGRVDDRDALMLLLLWR